MLALSKYVSEAANLAVVSCGARLGLASAAGKNCTPSHASGFELKTFFTTLTRPMQRSMQLGTCHHLFFAAVPLRAVGVHLEGLFLDLLSLGNRLRLDALHENRVFRAGTRFICCGDLGR